MYNNTRTTIIIIIISYSSQFILTVWPTYKVLKITLYH